MTTQIKDRFTNLANDYWKLVDEVYQYQWLDYDWFQMEILEFAKKSRKDLKDLHILDIWVWEWKTSKPFVDFWCKNVVWIDLNQDMIEKTKKNLWDNIELIQMDATDMKFESRKFDLIITSATIHNIPKEKRKLVWTQILNLSPDIFILSDKIADPDIQKHKKYYQDEVNAFEYIYCQKYWLNDLGQERIKHYEDDEREKLEISEVKDFFSEKYNLNLASELWVYKTVVATKQ